MLKDKLRLLREEKGFTQKEFAAIFNMSDARYNQYETGKRQPDYDTLKLFAEYYNVSMDYLLDNNYGKEKANPLSKKDEQDIAKTMERMKKQLSGDQDLLFNGEILDEETAKLLLDAIEQQEKMIKMINKKYTPNKHKKD